MEGITCRVCLQRTVGAPGWGVAVLGGKTVWPPAKLGNQSGRTEAREQIALCDQSPRAPTHLCYTVQETEGCLAEVWTRERPSFLDSRGRVPQAPAQVWACRELSPGWGWPRHPLKWGVICEVEPGA